MVNEFEIKKQLCDIGKRIYNRNMVAANDGNFSVKVAENEYLCTPTGVSKGFMTPEFICKVDGKGNVIQANPGFKPSSEIKMHMRVYEKRPDVGSVVHAHPVQIFSVFPADAACSLLKVLPVQHFYQNQLSVNFFRIQFF